MEIIEPSFEIETYINRKYVYEYLEKCIRTAYKSESMTKEGSAEKIIKLMLQKKHESTLEHFSFSVRFICDRGVSHELVRHRLASYTQESTRYVNYTKRQIQFIKPCWIKNKDDEDYAIWQESMEHAEEFYIELISSFGWKPEQARSVLPNSVKTEIVVTANLREWRHILRMRTASDAHPQIREICCPLLEELKKRLPLIFGDI
jgi:thymidylate synthase (FAD)